MNIKKTSKLPELVTALALVECSLMLGSAQAQSSTWIDSTVAPGQYYSNTANWQGGVVASGTDAIATLKDDVDYDETTLTLGGINASQNGPGAGGGPGSFYFFGTNPSNTLTFATTSATSGGPYIYTSNYYSSDYNFGNFTIAGTQGLTITSGYNTFVLGSGLTWTMTGTLTLVGGSGDTFARGNDVLPHNMDVNVTTSTNNTNELVLNGGTTQTIGALSGTGNVAAYNGNGQLRENNNSVNHGPDGTTITTGTASAASATNMATLQIGNTNDNGTFSGVIGTGYAGGTVAEASLNIIKLGTGTQILSGSNTYTGTTTISAGTLQIGAGGTTGSLSTSSTITDNGTFAVNRSNAVVQGTDFNGAVLTGSGGFTQAGTGSTTLNVANAYTGPTNVTGGTLILTASNTAATGATTVSNGAALQLQANAGNTTGTTSSAANAGTLTLNGGSILQLRSDSDVTFSSTNFSGENGTPTLNFDVNQLTTAGTGHTLTVAAGGFSIGQNGGYVNNIQINVTGGNGYALALGSILINNADGVTLNPTTANVTIAGFTNSLYFLNKTGAGTATVGSINSGLNNGVSVTAGTLILTGTDASGSNNNTNTTSVTGTGSQLIVNSNYKSTGNVTVGSGATLGGSGNIIGGTTNAISGTVAPGSAANTIGMLTLSSSSGATIAASGTYLVDLNATRSDNLLLSAGALTITSGATLTFNQLATLTASSYDLANYTSETGTFTVTNLPSGYTLQYGLTELDLVAAVPEPSTWTAGLLGLGVLGYRLRRLGGLFAA